MVHFIATSHSLIKIIRNRVNIKCSVIGKYIHNNLYIIFCSRIHHLLHLLTTSKNIISYFPVSRLIIIIPVSFRDIVIENFLSASSRRITSLHRGSLDHSESGIGNFLHTSCHLREIPAPGMEYCLSIHDIRIDRNTVF